MALPACNCSDHIVAVAERHMERSGVVDTKKDGASVISDIRTSSGTFLERGQDDIVKRVEEKIAAWTLLPVGNGEGMQVRTHGGCLSVP